MTDTDKWIQSTYKELDKRIAEQEDEFLDLFLNDYLSDFYVEDTTLKNSSGNYDKVNQINNKFDEAFETFIFAFLLWYGGKLLEAGKISLDYFNSRGIATNVNDISYLRKAIGIEGKKIIKGSFLWNLGKMGELRQRLQEKVIQAVSASQKLNVFIRNVKPIFKTKGKDKSSLAKYYLKYAYQPVMSTLNSVSYKLALKYGFDSFVYAGGLVEKSRQFCIDRNENEYTISDAKKWNDLEWNGKIQGVDFFVQCGGYKCLHHLEYTKSEEL